MLAKQTIDMLGPEGEGCPLLSSVVVAIVVLIADTLRLVVQNAVADVLNDAQSSETGLKGSSQIVSREAGARQAAAFEQALEGLAGGVVSKEAVSRVG